MPRFWLTNGLLLACAVVAGCQGSTPAGPSSETHSGETAEQSEHEKLAAGPSGVLPKLPVLTDVEGWEGNWVLAPTMQRQTLNFSLLRLSREGDGPWQAEILSLLPPPGKIEVTGVTIDEPRIRIQGELVLPQQQGPPQRAPWDFEGERQNHEVRGSMLLSWNNGLAPAQLIPTDADSLEGYAPSVLCEGVDEFDKSLQQPDPAHGLWKVAKSYRNSPLSLDAYNAIFGQIAQSRWTLTPEELKEMVADSASSTKLWGPRLHGLSLINAGFRLSEARKSLDLAEEQLNAGEQILPEKNPTVEGMLKTARLNIRTAQALAGLAADSEAAQAAAYADLQNLIVERRDHVQFPELVLSLAEYAQKTKQVDAAIDYYLTLVSLPVMEQMAISSRLGAPLTDASPRSALETLWKEKHGSLDGLEQALNERYEQSLTEAFEKLPQKFGPFPAAQAGQRAVLVELFTNVGCNPCVSAELALEAISREASKSQAILLQYHVHDPSPDPLTSMDGEGRATSYYKVEGRPTAVVDGRPVPNVGGLFFAPMLENAYRNLRLPIEIRLKTPTEISIKPQAEVVDGKLSVQVAVEGLTEEQLSASRLRLVVAEEQVEFASSNGIRRHPMVVRTMLGGASGISAKQGELKYSLQMPLAELKSRQLGYLASYASGRRIKFDQIPVTLKPLWLIAFVQNDTTREILQSAAVPISGDLVYPDIKVPDLNLSEPAGENADNAAAAK